MENKPIEAEKKKRGRKPKNLVDSTNTCSQENINDTNHIPKKRGRKPSKKQYFTSDVDLAIQEYLASSNQAERNEIYRTRIAYAFYKLAENLIHTFKFYYTEVETLEDLKHEVCCFFLEKLTFKILRF